MEFKININKSHAIVIIVLLVVVGFGIAQTPQNPGHPASQIDAGTFNGQFGFNDEIAISDDDSDFMRVTNTNLSQDHIAIASNKRNFGVWSTPNGGWADISARNIQASEGIRANSLGSSHGLYLGAQGGLSVSIYPVSGGSGSCNSRCVGSSLCLGAWKIVGTFGDPTRTSCTDSSGIVRCLCAGVVS
ncbi:hypothetical protein FJZ21_03105 [Candidatus Pacearchaeota archaeon]|nr:hypothetical protein [Candidatus Pacearchaeota archaeon]